MTLQRTAPKVENPICPGLAEEQKATEYRVIHLNSSEGNVDCDDADIKKGDKQLPLLVHD